MTPGLALISIGLHDERDLSLRALEEARTCDVLYAEMYTTKLDTNADRLGAIIGRPVQKIPRSVLEEGSDAILDEASSRKVGVLVGGDCLSATTHVSLLLDAAKKGIPTRVIHGSSVLTAVAETGLSPYKFGRTVTLPLPERGPADSVLSALEENLEHGLHTLILLDLDAEADRHLTVDQAVSILLDSEKSSVFDRETLIVGVARLGSDSPVIRAGKAVEIAETDFGAPPHAMIVPGQLHFLEAEALKIICGCPATALTEEKPRGILDRLVERYSGSCLRVLEELRLGGLPREVGEAEVKNLIEHAERYLRDAMYYARDRKATALASVCYSEGVLDALKLLDLVEFEW